MQSDNARALFKLLKGCMSGIKAFETNFRNASSSLYVVKN